MLLRSDIEAIDRPTVLSILYSTISAQQTKLLSENASKNNTIFQTTSQWLSSYGCAIIVLYTVYIYTVLCMFFGSRCKRCKDYSGSIVQKEGDRRKRTSDQA